MLKACLLGSMVTFGFVAIPIVHFITGLPSAFIGGYFAGSKLSASPGSAVLVGCVMASILVGPVGGVFFIMSLVWGVGAGALIAFTGGFAVWIALTATLGALLGGASARKQTAAEATGT